MRRLDDDIDRLPRFRRTFRGFDRTEVVAALAKLSSENAEARHQIDRLGAEIERLQSSVSDRLTSGGGDVGDVQRALVAATKVADEIRKEAEEAARRIQRDAEESARRIQREAEDRGRATVDRLKAEAQSLEGDIDALRARRAEVAASIESLIHSLTGELEQIRQEIASEPVDSKLAKTG